MLWLLGSRIVTERALDDQRLVSLDDIIFVAKLSMESGALLGGKFLIFLLL